MLVFVFQSSLVVFHVKLLCDYNAQLIIIAEKKIWYLTNVRGKISPFLSKIIHNLYLFNQGKSKAIKVDSLEYFKPFHFDELVIAGNWH